MPGIAEHIAYKYYADDACPIYSFGPKFSFLNEQIREQLLGGMTMVLHRMIELKSDPDNRTLPESVYLTPNGDRYESLVQLDFNSLVSIDFFIVFLE